MAATLGTPTVFINGVDLTNHIDTITFEETYADVDTTAYGSASKTRIAGLGDHKVTFSFQQDFAVASVEQTVYPLIGTVVPVIYKALSGATSSVNPSYSFNVLVTDWKPFDAKVGNLLMSNVTWPVSGGVTKSNT